MTTYYVWIVVDKNNNMPAHGLTVPIFWHKKVAQEFCNKQKGCTVKKLFIDDLKMAIEEMHFLLEVRTAFADYVSTEGCSCCRDTDGHEEANKRMGELLKAKPYSDGTGFDWSRYASKK